jgi:hypothetical protein
VKGRCWRYPRVYSLTKAHAVLHDIAADIARARAAGHQVKEVALCPTVFSDLMKFHYGRCCHGTAEPPPQGIDVPMVTDRMALWNIEVRTDGPTYLRRVIG